MTVINKYHVAMQPRFLKTWSIAIRAVQQMLRIG